MRRSKTAQAREAAALRKSLGYIAEEDFRALLGVATATLRNRQSAGELPPAYKLGREKVYRLSEIEAWIARRRVDRAVA